MAQRTVKGETPAAATTPNEEQTVKEKETFTKEEVAAILAVQQQKMGEAIEQIVEEKAQQVEQESAETVQVVTGSVAAMIERNKSELIKALEAELEKLAKAKGRFIGMNMEKYRDAVEQYRAVEEHLTQLKGGDVQKLIAEKYNGITRQAARAMHKTSDAIRKHGYASVNELKT